MRYPNPAQVTTPKGRVSDIEVLHDGGVGRWSAARLEWDGEPAIGLRWNGDEENPIGNPQSRGHPTWFIVPPELASVVEARAREESAQIEVAYRDMARDEKAEAEARSWADGLIADAAGTADETW